MYIYENISMSLFKDVSYPYELLSGTLYSETI